MIFPFPHAFPADAFERAVPDAASALTLGGDRMAGLEAALAARRAELAPLLVLRNDGDALLARTEDAIRIGYARLALRHGHWGNDVHAYHNEGHVLEILRDRIGRVVTTHGIHALGLRDWCALGLFAACHDLRQRETAEYAAGVGANERASTEETLRILDAVGFAADDDMRIWLDLMIAGSTFDARPAPGGAAFNPAELVQSGGALAAKLDAKLDKHRPGWRDDARIVHAHDLSLLAADLDTANVAEPFARFASSARNLCLEREMLCRRDLDAADSAMPVLGFLTDGQDRFFFDLHRFNSALGRETFQDAKTGNAARVKSLGMGLRARLAVGGMPGSGRDVLAAYDTVVARIAPAAAARA
ncbi:hypothetical protein ACQQ2N_05050 [Dokdonella sp. MW10]|uniref:hypothetical protein n=1 Tax=Dokdonella sp. MW10 TaxID=2992926 RepID=UPI003F7EFA62